MTYRAVTTAHRLPQRMDELEALLQGIEPSDGVMYDGVVAYRHREARLLESLGPVPPITIVAIDEGGEVDTAAHNQNWPDYSASSALNSRGRAQISFELRSRAATSPRLATWPRAASALINQRRQTKHSCDVVLDVARSAGAAGIVTAHSGTYRRASSWMRVGEATNKCASAYRASKRRTSSRK